MLKARTEHVYRGGACASGRCAQTLRRGLEYCPRQGAGFSPLTFGWSMRGPRIDRLATALGWSRQDIDELEQFRDEVVERVATASRPSS